MSDEATPFDNNATWVLAGATASGIVYVATIDPIFSSVNLWSYNDLRRKWISLASSEKVSILGNPYYNWQISAAYSERFGALDVAATNVDISSEHHLSLGHVEDRCSLTNIFRFSTNPEAKFINVYVADDDDEDIDFIINHIEPVLHYVGDGLIVAGSTPEDFANRLRIFQVIFSDGNGFTLIPLLTTWIDGSVNPDYMTSMELAESVSIGDELLMLTPPFDVQCFTPMVNQTPQSWLTWKARNISFYWDDRQYVSMCPSLCTANAVWMVAEFETVVEAVLDDVRLDEKRRVNWEVINENYYIPASNHLAASSTHLFWLLDNGETKRVMSKVVAVPTLQYLCLSTVFKSTKALSECKTEEDAVKLGIPRLAWRKFCG